MEMKEEWCHLINTQKPPIFGWIHCGQPSNSFDTITKIHKKYYQKKRCENGVTSNCPGNTLPYYANWQDFFYDASLPDEGCVWQEQVNVNLIHEMWETKYNKLKNTLLIDESTIPEAAKKLLSL